MSSPEPPGLVLQHEEAAPPALFAAWCDRREIPFLIRRVWEEGLPADPRAYPWICSLGSDHTPGEAGAPGWVDEEVAFLRLALDRDVPVLGLCFGGQALAAAAGAAVAPADPPEIGWFEVDTENAEQIPAGPWLYFHYDQFELPRGAKEIARSPAGTAAFRIGRNLGLQFHPEATPALAIAWARSDEERLPPGVTPSSVAVEGAAKAAEAASAAEVLFDRWWEGLQG